MSSRGGSLSAPYTAPQTTPVSLSRPSTVTGEPGSTRRSIPPQGAIRRNPSASISVTIMLI